MHNNAIKERLNMVLIFSCDWLLTNWMQFYFFVPISSFSVSSLFLWSHWRFTCEQVKINTLKLTLFFGPCAPLCRNMRTSEGILSLSLSGEEKNSFSASGSQMDAYTTQVKLHIHTNKKHSTSEAYMIASSLVKKWNYPLKPNTTCHMCNYLEGNFTNKWTQHWAEHSKANVVCTYKNIIWKSSGASVFQSAF